MIDKRVEDAGRRMTGWKAVSLEFKENELLLDFARRGKAAMRLVLKGIIGCKDSGLVGRDIAGYTVSDKGSYKQVDFLTPQGGKIFRATFMEIEIA
jgi:hypothetical protein